MKSVLPALQQLGRALMLPIAVLPVAAILLRLGQDDLWAWLPAIKPFLPFVGGAGDAIFKNLGLLFAIGVAVGLARENHGAAGLAGVVCFLIATKGAEKQVATIKRARQAREIRGVEHAGEVRETLEKLPVTITARTTGDGTKLFGSITATDIAAAVKAAGGPALDKRAIALDGHIRTTGAHPVAVTLHPGVTATVTVTVVSG